MTSLQSKTNALIKRLLPSGAGFITGAVTAGILYLGNHVFHIALLSSTVETALTPVIAFALASVAHNEAKVQAIADDAIGKVQAAVSKVQADDPVVKLLLTTVQTQIAAHPEFKSDLTKLVLNELTKAEENTPVPLAPIVAQAIVDVPKVVAEIKADETVGPLLPPASASTPTPAPIPILPPLPAPVTVPAEPAVVATDPPLGVQAIADILQAASTPPAPLRDAPGFQIQPKP